MYVDHAGTEKESGAEWRDGKRKGRAAERERERKLSSISEIPVGHVAMNFIRSECIAALHCVL
jgi:hypothetical protein